MAPAALRFQPYAVNTATSPTAPQKPLAAVRTNGQRIKPSLAGVA
jgi:hypothetical protein